MEFQRSNQRVKRYCTAVNGSIPWHSYGVSLAMWDHTVLPATRHKWTHPALTAAMQAGTRFTYRGGMEGWVDLEVSKWTMNVPTASTRCDRICVSVRSVCKLVTWRGQFVLRRKWFTQSVYNCTHNVSHNIIPGGTGYNVILVKNYTQLYSSNDSTNKTVKRLKQKTNKQTKR